MKGSIYFVLILLALSGCASESVWVLKNTSPEPVVPDINKLSAIPASISINADKEEFSSDVKQALTKNRVFSAISEEKDHPELLLKITHNTIANHHMDENANNSFAADLGLSGNNPDIFDYSIEVKADLVYQGKTIASYNTLGSFHSEISDSATLKAKLARTSETVKLSFDHALDLLSAKIKKDREKIITEMTPQ